MPTPFYHLSIGEDLLRHPCLSDYARFFLENEHCAFLFGHTAPDVQVVSGQDRTATHFFDLPIHPGDPPAWERLLDQHPRLAHPEQMPPTQAAFVAGYLCHLQADWTWVVEIFAPVFGLHCAWGTFRQRLYLHNVLRSYLDFQILPGLPAGLAHCLQGVAPTGWLPFVRDEHLRAWRDLLFPQLQPGGAARTVEVFAERQGIATSEYYALLGSEPRMQQEVFAHLPVARLEVYRQRLLEENVILLNHYLTCFRRPDHETDRQHQKTSPRFTAPADFGAAPGGFAVRAERGESPGSHPGALSTRPG